MTNFPPVPCAHCGTNFMRHDLDPDAPKLCNNCQVREKQRNQSGVKMTHKVRLIAEVDPQIHVEIEEICLNKGMSIGQYLTQLHQSYTSESWKVKAGLEVMNSIGIHPITDEKDKSVLKIGGVTEDIEKRSKKKKIN